MNNFNQLRKMAHVFHLYGINLTGKRKFDNLYNDLKMDQIFVMGLLFELELATKSQVKDEDVYRVQTPAQVIKLLIAQR